MKYINGEFKQVNITELSQETLTRIDQSAAKYARPEPTLMDLSIEFQKALMLWNVSNSPIDREYLESIWNKMDVHMRSMRDPNEF